MDYLKNIFNWFVDILTINQRLKKLEQIHNEHGRHPADICPSCGNHSLYQESEFVYVSCINYTFTYVQNIWSKCRSCHYKHIVKSSTIQTRKEIT